MELNQWVKLIGLLFMTLHCHKCLINHTIVLINCNLGYFVYPSSNRLGSVAAFREISLITSSGSGNNIFGVILSVLG